MYYSFFLFLNYSPIEKHMGSFQLLAIMNKAAMNVHVQVSV